MGRIVEFLHRHPVDVLCMQEIKCRNEEFPQDIFDELGYSCAVLGQKTYNGVAIASRLPMDDMRAGLGDAELDSQARLISVEIAGLRIFSAYVPNGADIEGEKYQFKLRWLRRLREYLEESHTIDELIAICGDTNVIIHDNDAHDIAPWRQTGLACEEIRRTLRGVTDWGLTDIFHRFNPDGGVFSWWDYRHLAFPHNIGLRIDHIFTTPPLAEKICSCSIDRNSRKGEKPSDHAPVIAEFEI